MSMQEKNRGSPAPKEGLPPELDRLLAHKVKVRRRQFDETMSQSRLEILERARVRIQEHLPDSAQNPGRRSEIFLDAFKEISQLAVQLTDKWPRMVWQALLETLESTSQRANSAKELQEVLDRWTWPNAAEAFTLKLVDPNWLQNEIDIMLGRYGLPGVTSEAHLARQWSIEAALAEVAVRHAARDSRERIAVAMEQFMMTPASSFPQIPAQTQPNSEAACAIEDCLPGLPSKRNNLWVAVICDAVNVHIEEYGSCPDVHELWTRLRSGGTPRFQIKSGKDRGNEDAIFCDGESLGKRAFQQRFGRYKKPSAIQ